MRNVKIEGLSLQAACIKLDATFTSCQITINEADGFVGYSQWLPEQPKGDDKLGTPKNEGKIAGYTTSTPVLNEFSLSHKYMATGWAAG